eukprot:UN27593
MASQDGVVRVLETDTFKVTKEVVTDGCGWAIVDVAYSKDKRYIAYSSWNPNAFLVNTYGVHQLHEPIPIRGEDHQVCLFTINFSPDGRYLLAGLSDGSVVVHDLERKENILDTENGLHKRDVNTACFVDQSGNIIASGSHDACILLVDRRE